MVVATWKEDRIDTNYITESWILSFLGFFLGRRSPAILKKKYVRMKPFPYSLLWTLMSEDMNLRKWNTTIRDRGKVFIVAFRLLSFIYNTRNEHNPWAVLSVLNFTSNSNFKTKI